jgi:hypothetical protein
MSDVAPTARDRETTLAIAARVKRQTTNADILALCEAVVLLSGASCPVCASRRAAKAASQKRWRANARSHARQA